MTTGENANVLIVEDEADVAEMYWEWLEPQHDVGIGHSGADALDRIDESTDVVLLDRMLPDMSGEEVLEGIRDRTRDCEVVIVSAIEPGFDVLDVGFDDYLTKPTTESELTAAVRRALTRQAYVTSFQRFLGLSTKLATLESAMDVEQLEGHPEYVELRSEFSELVSELAAMSPDDETYGDLYEVKLQRLLETTLHESHEMAPRTRS